jgi:hypothetical protein
MSFVSISMSMSDPADLISLLSLQMPVVCETVVLGKFYAVFSDIPSHSRRTAFHIQFTKRNTHSAVCMWNHILTQPIFIEKLLKELLVTTHL